VEIVGREAAALILQLPTGWADWRNMEAHMRLLWRPSAFFEVAGRTSRRDIFPRRPSALSARHNMIERQILGAATILAGEAVAQKQVKPGKRGILRWLHILFERNYRRKLHREIGAVHLTVIFLNDINTVKKHRFNRILPRPERERIIAQRGVIGVQNQGRATVGMADEVWMIHSRLIPLLLLVLLWPFAITDA
jgi:hypothetical protein